MKHILTLIAAVLLVSSGTSAASQSQQAPASPEPCLHVQTTVDIVVHAPYTVAAPLFGPLGERL